MRSRMGSVVWMVRGRPPTRSPLGPSARGVFAAEQGRTPVGIDAAGPFIGARAEEAQDLVAIEAVFLSAWVRNRARTPSRYLALILPASICMGIVSEWSNVPVRCSRRCTLTLCG